MPMFILNIGIRRGGRLTSRSGPLYPRERTQVPIVEKAGWAPKSIWTFWRQETSPAFTGIRPLDRPANILVQRFPNFLLANPFWLRKINTDPYTTTHVNVRCPDDMYSKLKIYILELISESYLYQ
jgi:hypothetical protein